MEKKKKPFAISKNAIEDLAVRTGMKATGKPDGPAPLVSTREASEPASETNSNKKTS